MLSTLSLLERHSTPTALGKAPTGNGNNSGEGQDLALFSPAAAAAAGEDQNSLFSPAASPVEPPTKAACPTPDADETAPPQSGDVAKPGLFDTQGGNDNHDGDDDEDDEQIGQLGAALGDNFGTGEEIADDEHQFLSFLAGLAATEHEAPITAAAEEGEEAAGVAGNDGMAAAEGLVQQLPAQLSRRSGRAPKPKRPQEAPGTDGAAQHKPKKSKHVQDTTGDGQAHSKETQQPLQQRKMPRIRLTSSSMESAEDKQKRRAEKKARKNAKRSHDGVSASRAEADAAKRPRIRLASSSVQQAYDAAAAANEDGSDDEDHVPLFSIKNKEREKKDESPEQVLSQLRVGCAITVKAGKGSKGWPGRVVELDPLKLRVLVHFMGWNARYDRWVRAKWSRISLDAEADATAASKQRTQANEEGSDDEDPFLEAVASKSTPRSVSWIDCAEPAQPIRLRTRAAAGGFLNPNACQPRQLGVTGIRFDMLTGGHRAQSRFGQQLLDRYRGLTELVASAPQTDGQPLRDGLHLHSPLLSGSAAKTVSTLLLRVGSQLVGAATFRILHSGGEAAERQDDSSALVLEVLGLAVMGESPATSRLSRQSPLATFGAWLVNGLKAIAWAEAEQLGEPRRQASRGTGSDGGVAAVRRRGTRSKGSRQCCIFARPTDEHAATFWLEQKLRPGADADAVAAYVAAGKTALQHSPDASAALCLLQPDGSDVQKPPPSVSVDKAAASELHAAVTIQKALRSLFAAREQAALEAARREAELERQRAAEEDARQQAEEDAEEIEDTVEDIIRIIVGKAAAAKAKAKREAKAAAKAAVLAKSKATREANAAARKIEEAKQAAELQVWQDGLQAGSWCVEDETDRAGQLSQAPDQHSGVVEVVWADGGGHISTTSYLDDLRPASVAEEAAAVAMAKATKLHIAAEQAAAAEAARRAAEQAEKEEIEGTVEEIVRIIVRKAAAVKAKEQREAKAKLKAEREAAVKLAAEQHKVAQEVARAKAVAEAARQMAALKAGVHGIILTAGDGAAALTLKMVRSALEQQLGLDCGALDAKKAEVKATVRDEWAVITAEREKATTQRIAAEQAAAAEAARRPADHAEAAQVKLNAEREAEAKLAAAERPKKSKNSKNAAAAEVETVVDHGSYKCVKKAVLRAEVGLTSDKVGRLKPGEVFKALEVRAVEGQLRVRGEMGWASFRSMAGNDLLEKVSDGDDGDESE